LRCRRLCVRIERTPPGPSDVLRAGSRACPDGPVGEACRLIPSRCAFRRRRRRPVDRTLHDGIFGIDIETLARPRANGLKLGPMYGTDSIDALPDPQDTGHGAGAESRVSFPSPIATVRLGGIITYRILDDEDDDVLVVSDGVTTVEFACGLPGPSGRSVRGAQDLAEAVAEYASAI